MGTLAPPSSEVGLQEEPMNQKPTCPHCGGSNIVAEAVCTWSGEKQGWELAELTDSFFCTTCEETLKWVEMVDLSTFKAPVNNPG